MSERLTRQGVRDLNTLPGRGAIPERRRLPRVRPWHSCIAESEVRDEYDGYGYSRVIVCRVCGRRDSW